MISFRFASIFSLPSTCLFLRPFLCCDQRCALSAWNNNAYRVTDSPWTFHTGSCVETHGRRDPTFAQRRREAAEGGARRGRGGTSLRRPAKEVGGPRVSSFARRRLNGATVASVFGWALTFRLFRLYDLTRVSTVLDAKTAVRQTRRDKFPWTNSFTTFIATPKGLLWSPPFASGIGPWSQTLHSHPPSTNWGRTSGGRFPGGSASTPRWDGPRHWRGSDSPPLGRRTHTPWLFSRPLVLLLNWSYLPRGVTGSVTDLSTAGFSPHRRD